MLFVTEQDKKFVVHCLDCAKHINAHLDNFVVLNQYKMAELMDVYDNFQLGAVVSILSYFFIIVFLLYM